MTSKEKIVELEVKPDLNNKHAHYLTIWVNGKSVSQVMITLDEIEDLEGDLTNEILYLSAYRLHKNRKINGA